MIATVTTTGDHRRRDHRRRGRARASTRSPRGSRPRSSTASAMDRNARSPRRRGDRARPRDLRLGPRARRRVPLHPRAQAREALPEPAPRQAELAPQSVVAPHHEDRRCRQRRAGGAFGAAAAPAQMRRGYGGADGEAQPRVGGSDDGPRTPATTFSPGAAGGAREPRGRRWRGDGSRAPALGRATSLTIVLDDPAEHGSAPHRARRDAARAARSPPPRSSRSIPLRVTRARPSRSRHFARHRRSPRHRRSRDG